MGRSTNKINWALAMLGLLLAPTLLAAQTYPTTTPTGAATSLAQTSLFDAPPQLLPPIDEQVVPASVSPLPPPPTAPPATPTPAPPVEAAPLEVAPIETLPIESPAVEPPTEDAPAIEVCEPEPPPVSWYRPTSWFRDDPWDVGMELGINGSSGTSDSISIRTGGYLRMKNDRRKIDTSLYYNKTSADGNETQSNALLKSRHDWLYADSPWTVYLSNQTFYDEFQAFDLDVSVNSGFGYQLLEEEWVKLSTSFGAGASREYGGIDDEWTPEAQFGVDWSQEVSSNQRVYAKVDFFPQFEDFSKHRVLTDVGMEFDLSCPSNVSLKVSATDRYDSDPGGVAPHNTNYSVLLLWKR